MKTFLSITLSIVAILLGGYAILHPQTITQFGATSNAGANALFEQSLAQPLGTTDANMYVTSGADVQGNLLPLNSYQCLSVDTGQPNFEAICGTVTTSSTAGLTLLVSLRGLSTQTATTSNASFIFTHRRGADVRITDFPTLTVVNNELNGVQNIPNLLTYDTGVLINGSSPSSTVATKYYVDNVVSSGAPNATTLVKGIIQLATAAQAALGSILGSTGASLVIPSSLATSTPYNSGSNVVPITGTNEKLSQLFLDLTQAFNVSGLWNFSATTTMATTTIASTTIQNANVINSTFINTPGFPGGVFNYQDFTSSGTWTKPVNASSTAIVVVQVWGGGGGGGGNAGVNGGGGGGGGGGAYITTQYRMSDLPNTVIVTVGIGGTGGIGATPANATAGGNSTFASTTAYGGGFGTNESSGPVLGAGGGGGGTLGAGANASGANGGAGGGVNSGVLAGGAAGSPGVDSNFGGGGGGTAATNGGGGNSLYGGGGGCGATSNSSNLGGNSLYGGGGGGCSSSGSARIGGVGITFGNDGGSGGSAGNGNNGKMPGGGGGGAGVNGTNIFNGGNGANGEVRVWVEY